jgi:hypothetical protein
VWRCGGRDAGPGRTPHRPSKPPARPLPHLHGCLVHGAAQIVRQLDGVLDAEQVPLVALREAGGALRAGPFCA